MIMWSNGHNKTIIVTLLSKNVTIKTEINVVGIDHTKANHKVFRNKNKKEER